MNKSDNRRNYEKKSTTIEKFELNLKNRKENKRYNGNSDKILYNNKNNLINNELLSNFIQIKHNHQLSKYNQISKSLVNNLINKIKTENEINIGIIYLHREIKRRSK